MSEMTATVVMIESSRRATYAAIRCSLSTSSVTSCSTPTIRGLPPNSARLP